MKLRDANVIVTGAGSGIGRAVALSLAQLGAHVTIVGRSPNKLAETASMAEKLPEGSGKLFSDVADLVDPKQAHQVVETAQNRSGPIALLINNAGGNVRKRMLRDLSLEDWESLLRMNLHSAFNMIHAVLPGMRKKKAGLIINISSIAGVRPSPLGGAGYSAAKFGVNALSGVLSLEEAENGIRSTVICPGEVNTPILNDRPEPVSDERKAKMLQPADVAAAVLFVALLPARAHVPELIIKPTVQAFA